MKFNWIHSIELLELCFVFHSKKLFHVIIIIKHTKIIDNNIYGKYDLNNTKKIAGFKHFFDESMNKINMRSNGEFVLLVQNVKRIFLLELYILTHVQMQISVSNQNSIQSHEISQTKRYLVSQCTYLLFMISVNHQLKMLLFSTHFIHIYLLFYNNIIKLIIWSINNFLSIIVLFMRNHNAIIIKNKIFQSLLVINLKKKTIETRI